MDRTAAAVRTSGEWRCPKAAKNAPVSLPYDTIMLISFRGRLSRWMLLVLLFRSGRHNIETLLDKYIPRCHCAANTYYSIVHPCELIFIRQNNTPAVKTRKLGYFGHQSINQSLKTLIQVDKPQRDGVK